MSLNIVDGGVYQILTRYHTGGYVYFGSDDVVELADEPSDDSEKVNGYLVDE